MEVKSDKEKMLNKAIHKMAAKIKRNRVVLNNQREANGVLASKMKKSEEEKAGLLSQIEANNTKSAEMEQKQKEMKSKLEKFTQERSKIRGGVLKMKTSLTKKVEECQRLTHCMKEMRHMCQEIVSIRQTISNEKQNIEASKQLFEPFIKKIMERVSKVDSNAVATISKKYNNEMILRKKYFNVIQELKGNIRVYVRCRPPMKKETCMPQCLKMSNNENVNVADKERGVDYAFKFERVFGQKSQQEDIFEELGGTINSVLDGYNVCIFAYGQTGTGKTYTMEGTKENPGVNVRALQKIFHEKSVCKSKDFSIQITMCEIYCEKLFDLLSETKGAKVALKVKQNSKGESIVEGINKITINSYEELVKIFENGQRNRSTGVTNMNSHSSRSHLILSVYVNIFDKIVKETAHGKLHLIDLAGSERLAKSGAQGQMEKEAIKINSSLSALGAVISARAEKKGHIPYRNSVLTWLLKDSLE
eukprot:UN25164